jgi:hypothetical protein
MHVAPLIIAPMYIQLFFPITALLPDYSIQKILAWLDRRFTNQKLYKTNCKTALQYAEINSGAEHLLLEKYPRLVNIVMISMMYSFGLPIFYIITLLCLIISYILDKLIVAYYHRRPPMYDDSLNLKSAHFLKWGAFIYLAIAYWMITNRQMFENIVYPLEYQDEGGYYGHYLNTPSTYTHQSILYWITIITGILLLSFDFFFGSAYMLIKSSIRDEVQDQEDLLGKIFSTNPF